MAGKGEPFENPARFAFDSLGNEPCVVCEDIPIIRCSGCKDTICGSHFLTRVRTASCLMRRPLAQYFNGAEIMSDFIFLRCVLAQCVSTQ